MTVGRAGVSSIGLGSCRSRPFGSRRSLTALASLLSPFSVVSLVHVNHVALAGTSRRWIPTRLQHDNVQPFMIHRSMTAKSDSLLHDDALANGEPVQEEEEPWQDLLPFQDWSHNSAKIIIGPCSSNNNDDNEEDWNAEKFLDRLIATVLTLRHRDINKSSVWIEVHISRSHLVPLLAQLGFQYHHAQGDTCVLNLWLPSTESLVPEFATHHLGVGGVVLNSRREILCVRERRAKSFSLPWKIPGGLAHLGESIEEAVVREILEETGIHTTFRNVLCFRHAHGLAHGRSDLYFVCRLDPVEDMDQDGNVVIPQPVAQEAEIEVASWVPYTEFRDMVQGDNGHPMISHVLDLLDRGHAIDSKIIRSLVPGRKSNPIYSSISSMEETEDGTQP